MPSPTAVPSRRGRKSTFGAIARCILVLLPLFAACGGRVCHEYRHTPTTGWGKNDTLAYDVAPMSRSGQYTLTLGLRANRFYPFTSITLIVEHTTHRAGRAARPTETASDTVRVPLSGRGGVSYAQYSSHVSSLTLAEGDSLHITVHHDMKRDILPGISDVGIRIDRAGE